MKKMAGALLLASGIPVGAFCAFAGLMFAGGHSQQQRDEGELYLLGALGCLVAVAVGAVLLFRKPPASGRL